MGTTLDNGTYLPDEGERNCYDGLAGNWVALDNHLGSTDIHVTINDKQAWDGHVADTTIHVTSADKQTWNSHVADTTIHVTSADKQAWNGKADASALTAHTGDTTIHVTAEDKQAWNGKADASALTAHTGDTTIHVTSADKQAWDGHVADSVKHVTAEDKAKWDAVTSKANDSDVVHKSGNETITGTKTFENVNIQLKSTSAEYSVSGGYKSVSFHDKNLLELSRIRLGVYSSGLSYIKQTILGYDSNNQQVDTSITFSWSSLTKPFIRPDSDNLVSLGTTGNRWYDVQTRAVNNLEPSSLSLPSGNASDVIDISSYLVKLDGTDNTYVAPANGWITIKASTATGISCTIPNLWNDSRIRTSAGGLKMLFPILKGKTVYISIYATTIDMARFIPCRGNV